MKKSDLKNGCVVETRNGTKSIKIDNTLVNFYIFNDKISCGWLKFDDYNEDLTYKSVDEEEKEWDIMKVNNNVTNEKVHCFYAIYNVFNTQKDTWTWIREKKDILTDEEREYLKAVIAPVKEYVVNITKCNHDCINCISGFKHIRIELNNYIGNYMTLDNFEYYVKFKGMELGKKYTLDELGLE